MDLSILSWSEDPIGYKELKVIFKLLNFAFGETCQQLRTKICIGSSILVFANTAILSPLHSNEMKWYHSLYSIMVINIAS